jgi:hypothetical protein
MTTPTTTQQASPGRRPRQLRLPFDDMEWQLGPRVELPPDPQHPESNSRSTRRALRRAIEARLTR